MMANVRLRLTLVYATAAVLLVVLIGAGGYGLLVRYFAVTTEQALLQRMALEFSYLQAPLPAGLRPFQPQPNETGTERGRAVADVTATFVYPLAADGSILYDPNPAPPPLAPDLAAVASALAGPRDWRTITLPDGTRVRLLTERLSRSDGPAVLQVGRVLSEQDAALRLVLGGLVALGGGAAVAMGWMSWLLAGRALRASAQAWERQQAFVANASHELRAPLTLLRASAETVLRGLPPDNPDRELLDDVLAETDHMTSLVEDLLLLGRLDAQRVEFVRTPLDLAALLDDVAKSFALLAAPRNVLVRAQAPAGLQVRADPTRLRQVLVILLDNALRHTPPGGQILVRAIPAERTVRISVADTGEGIAPQDLARIFERFYRGDSSRSAGSSGSGLGLAIAKALIDGQGGRISASSEIGVGTTVVVELPAS